MLKSKIYPNSKHRLGNSPRVKNESNKSGCGGTADALVSGSSEEIRVGSNPVIRTNKRGTALVVVPFLFLIAKYKSFTLYPFRSIYGISFNY